MDLFQGVENPLLPPESAVSTMQGILGEATGGACTMRITAANHCPVCGYDLGFPAWRADSASDEICPCCRIQFGFDDWDVVNEGERAQIYASWRKRWIDQGMKWNSKGRKPPDGWNPVSQLRLIGVQL